MAKFVGYARVSTKGQVTDRQHTDLMAAGVPEANIYTDLGFSGSRARRPALDAALATLENGDTFVVCTLDRLGRSTINMLDLARQLREQGVGLRVLNLGGGDVDTATPMGSMVFTVLAALAEMELEIKRERIQDSVKKRRAKNGNLGGRPRKYTDDQIRYARRRIESGEISARQMAKEIGINRETLYRRITEMKAREAGFAEAMEAQQRVAANPEALRLLREDPQAQAARSVPRPERRSTSEQPPTV